MDPDNPKLNWLEIATIFFAGLLVLSAIVSIIIGVLHAF